MSDGKRKENNKKNIRRMTTAVERMKKTSWYAIVIHNDDTKVKIKIAYDFVGRFNNMFAELLTKHRIYKAVICSKEKDISDIENEYGLVGVTHESKR